MLSRRATKYLAELYNGVFTGSYKRKIHKIDRYVYLNEYKFDIDKLYDFLYVRDYPEWFLIAIKNINQYEKRSALEFIMGLNTGSFFHQAKINPDDKQHKQMVEAGKNLLNKLAQDMLVFVYNDIEFNQKPTLMELYKNLLHQLEFDGFIFRDNILYKTESKILDFEEETGTIHQYIKELKLNNQEITLHHLEHIEKDYIDEKWDDSIGNSRKFLESVLQEIADKHSMIEKGSPLPSEIKKWAGKVRGYLETEELFSEPEIKTFREIYGLMSETGNHPYIAQKDQAILIRNLALTLAQFALLRYSGWLKKI